MSDSAKPSPQRIVFIAYPGMQSLDLVGPMDVFAQANERFGPHYDIRILCNACQPMLSGGLKIVTEPMSEFAIDTLIVPGGDTTGLNHAMADKVLMTWIASAARRAERVVTICTGAFLLVPSGLLSGRRVATHWAHIDRLSLIAPDIIPEREAMYTEDGRFWSSAGVSAGIDLALAILRRDLGAERARAVARDLVVTLARPMRQSAYAGPYLPTDGGDEPLNGLLDHVMQHLNHVINISQLAEALGLSTRTFHRRCLARYGITPARFVQDVRLNAVCTLLLNHKLPLKQIAQRTGFANESSLSSAFRSKFGVSPSSFRQGFCTSD